MADPDASLNKSSKMTSEVKKESPRGCVPCVSDDDVVEGVIDAAEALEADLDYHAVEGCGRRNVVLDPTLKDQACLARSDER